MIEAIVQVSIVVSDTRASKVVRFFGVPVFVKRVLDVRTDVEPKLFEL